MATFLDGVFFFYTFVGLYMLSMFMIIYLMNSKKIFDYPKGKIEPVSIVMPCYNESESVGGAIEALLNLDWPKDKLEIIIVDDASTDNSVEIIKRYAKKDSRIKLIVNKVNSGKAAGPKNIGAKAAKYDYIAFTDADSIPQRDALKKMIGFLQQDEKVGGVTCAVLANKGGNFIQKLQEIEYTVIAFGRKLLDCVDSVYVTPGPFCLYKKKVFMEVGMFDAKNMTEDIELVWRMLDYGYFARMCLATQVRATTPSTFKKWWKQRLRWNIGGNQTLWSYKGLVLRKGMLGAFIIPFFSLSLFIGLFGLGIFAYLMAKRLLIWYLSATYSVYVDTAILHLQDLSFSPSVLNYFGVILFLLGSGYTLFGLTVMNEKELRNKHVFTLIFYLSIYLMIYPFIMINALTQLLTGKYSWR